MANRTKPSKNRKINPNSLANLKKGGSPGRKPEPPEIKAMFLAASPEAAELLINTMKDSDVKIDIRVDCANEILNRGIGKAAQSVAIGNIEGETFKTSNIDLSHLTVEELKELLGDEDT